MTVRKVKEIADYIGGELMGDGEIEISNIRDIKEAGEGDVAFILHPRFAGLMNSTKASCIIAPREVEKASCALIRAKNPSLAFTQVVDFLEVGKIPHPAGIHKTAVIGEKVKLGENVALGANCVIEPEVEIGNNTVIYPLAFIGRGSKVGDDTIIYSNVSVRERVIIGSRVIIHAGTVIGSDGFGFDSSTGRHVKIPQIGDVIIEDDVEIGACVTIDRAKFAHTLIGKGTKIDNLVQIAHNVQIGENCIVVAQCGVSGSSELGKYVIMGGQVGIVDHIKVGDQVMIGAQAGVTKDVPPGTIMLGSPARPIRKQKKIFALIDMLPELYDRIKKLEKTLKITAKD